MKRTMTIAAATLLLAGGCQKKQESAPAQSADSSAVGARSGMQPASTDMPADTLAAGPWHWVGTQTPVERIMVTSPGNYTLEFLADSSLAAQIDCNRGHGKYHVDGKAIRLGPMAVTRMMCPPGSMDAEFGKELDAARVWFMNADTLMLDLFADSGTMRFVR